MFFFLHDIEYIDQFLICFVFFLNKYMFTYFLTVML